MCDRLRHQDTEATILDVRWASASGYRSNYSRCAIGFGIRIPKQLYLDVRWASASGYRSNYSRCAMGFGIRIPKQLI
ncbi:MAG: hypothetical protein NT018_10655 [Armatimonadetes bacterium]|nr:hypothetical protein [Armatimonadota bacterium]